MNKKVGNWGHLSNCRRKKLVRFI